ncbi:MAG: hypothetical protein IJ781_09375 [Atopobiaceae bacterium]|nr:hypothetical protein [Atopobiaceae bacterium]
MAEYDKLDAALHGVWESLTDEQKAKARACKSAEEVMRLVAEEGIELPDEMLQAVSGGVLFRTSRGARATGDPNDTFDVINDKTGEVMEGGILGRGNAEARARALGQDPDEVLWTYVDHLRTDAARC